MKRITIVFMLLIRITVFSQNQPVYNFEEANLAWELGIGADFEKAIDSIAKIKIKSLEIDKEKTILILTVQKKSIKWHKFKQRSILRKEIKKFS